MKTNKKDQRGITHHLMLIGLAVVVAGAIGFAGFRIYKSKNDISAKAANWTTVINQENVLVNACKSNATPYSYKYYVLNRRSNSVKYSSSNGIYGTVKPNSNSYVQGGSWSGFTVNVYPTLYSAASANLSNKQLGSC